VRQPAALLLGFRPLALSSPLLQPPLAAVLLLLHLHHLFEPVLLLLQLLLPPPRRLGEHCELVGDLVHLLA